MKKMITGLFIALFSIGTVSAEIGLSVGVSGQMGLFAASGTETDRGTHGTTTGGNELNSESDYLGAGWASIFVEKTLGERFFLGLDYVPSALETEEKQDVKIDYSGVGGVITSTSTNRYSVDFEDMTSLYVGVKLGEALYVKAGTMTVDVITNDVLGTGSTYGNTDMDGTMFGIGMNKTFDNGLFARVEGTYMEWDGASVTSANGVNTMAIDNLDGVSGKISVGKTF